MAVDDAQRAHRGVVGGQFKRHELRHHRAILHGIEAVVVPGESIEAEDAGARCHVDPADGERVECQQVEPVRIVGDRHLPPARQERHALR